MQSWEPFFRDSQSVIKTIYFAHLSHTHEYYEKACGNRH